MVASQYSMNVFFVNRVTVGRDGTPWGTGPGECKCGGGGVARETGCLPSGSDNTSHVVQEHIASHPHEGKQS